VHSGEKSTVGLSSSYSEERRGEEDMVGEGERRGEKRESLTERKAVPYQPAIDLWKAVYPQNH
jgi:hypothetical protein